MSATRLAVPDLTEMLAAIDDLKNGLELIAYGMPVVLYAHGVPAYRGRVGMPGTYVRVEDA